MKNHNNIRKKTAFTLIELIVAVMLSAILMAGMGMIVETAFQSYEFNTDLADKTQTLRAALNRISREIRNADNVSFASNVLTITTGADVATYTLNTSTDQLIYVKGGSSAVVLGPEYDIAVDSIVYGENEAPEQGATLLVKLTFTLTMDGQTVNVTTSACPRKNHLYIPEIF